MRRFPIQTAHIGLAFLTVATACGAGLETPTEVRQFARPGILTERDPNPVVESVTGHWEVIGVNGNTNKLSVNALKRLDGSVSGTLEYERVSPDGGWLLRAHGDVICVTVNGNTARVAIVGEEVDNTGTTTSGYGYVTAVDNGEGENDPPDRGSSLFGTSSEGLARRHCDVPIIPDARIFPNQRGNIQVRSGT
ncbi:MAG: hypothetical protein ACJ796_05235 [Gemmatimonadaceae bacterium]